MARRLKFVLAAAGSCCLLAQTSCGAGPTKGDDGLPALDQAIPRAPAKLATALTDTTRDLHAAIDRWRATGDPRRGPTPADVTALALYEQRIYLLLGDRPSLAARVRPRLRGPARAEAPDILSARRALLAVGRQGRPKKPKKPKKRSQFRPGRALPPDVLKAYYQRAERRFKVDWEVLAAVNFVETGFNKIRSASSAGAQGPMQFIPATWRRYGMGGNIRDPGDAIMGAANYLHRSGAPRNYGRALFAYNNSRLYVRAVKRYARRIKQRPQAFYALHSWQVFVAASKGRERLTGPGL